MNWLKDTAGGRAKRLISQLADPDRRQKAMQELAHLGPEAVPALVEALGSKQPELPSLAADVLAKIGAPAQPALIHALQQAHPLVRLQAARALGGMKDASAIPALLTALKGEFYTVRAAAATALGSIGDRQALDDLLAALKDPEPLVRAAAVEAVGSFGTPGTFEAIESLLLDDTKTEVRQAAARALGGTGLPAALPLLMEALHDSFWWYEREAAAADLLNAIEAMGETALPSLVEALNDPERAVRRFAVQLLGRLRAYSAVEPLGMSLYDLHHEVARAAALALGSIGPASLDVLEAAALHDEADLRENVALALASIDHVRAADLLLAFLQDPDRNVQIQAVQSLAFQQDPRAIAALLQISGDRSDRELRTIAQNALRKLNLTA